MSPSIIRFLSCASFIIAALPSLVFSLDVIVHKTNTDEILTAELPLHFLANSTVGHKNISFPKANLKALNLSAEQVKHAKVEVGQDGSETFVSADGLRVAFRKADFKDPSLRPETLPPLKWVRGATCNMSGNILISVNTTSVTAWLNGVKVLNIDAVVVGENSEGITAVEEKGLIVSAVNMRTCQVTYQELFPMDLHGNYRNLNWILDSLSPGTLVLLTSLFDGSLLLHETSRGRLSSAGSSWSNSYMYRDGWVLAFVKGAAVMMDTLVPNLGSLKTSAAPYEVSFTADDSKYSIDDCPHWPITDEWEARKIFCNNHEAFGKLCNCEDPLQIPEDSAKPFDPGFHIPISILAGGRTWILVRLLETLFRQKNLRKNMIMIAMDGYHEGVVKVAYILGLKILYHRPEGIGGTRISRLLRFALYNQLELFPNAKFFINLEDDLVLATDFYSYMQQISPVFDMDPTIWCVSGFNINSFPHTSKDPSLLYRGSIVPTLGWMMPKSAVMDLLSMWPPADRYHNWDFFMAQPHVNKDRICIVPDVVRSNHPTGGGIHFPQSLYVERLYGVKELNRDENVRFGNLERLKQQNYIREISEMAANSTVVEISDIKNFSISPRQSKVFTIYLDKTSSRYENTSKVVHSILGASDSTVIKIPDVERFHYFNATILIIAVPSLYSLHVPANYTFFEATHKDVHVTVNRNEKIIAKKMAVPTTHEGGVNLPFKDLPT